jgi:hypothetical protein
MISFGGGQILRRPELAAMIAHIATLWPWVEFQAGLCLAQILGGKSNVGLAMYTAVVAGPAQKLMLEQAAKVGLEGERRDVFLALLRLFESLQKRRNPLAHWLWGISTDLPDALLAAEPKGDLRFLGTLFVNRDAERSGSAFLYSLTA